MLLTLVLIIVVTIGTLAFLISNASIFRGEDYIKLHASSLMASLLRADSGYNGDIEKCRTVADILFCSQTTPSWRCDDVKCEDIADSLTDLYIQKTLDPKYDYYFKYGDKVSPLSKGIGNRTAAYKLNQKISKRGQDVDVVFWVAEK